MTGSHKIRALVVDDEPLGRKRVRRLLSFDPDIEIAGECVDGREAIASIKSLRPDIVFLDIQMPEADAFEVLEEIPVDSVPLIVFVTAHDSYALKAFEVSAVDYVLKPFDRERFERAVARAKTRLTSDQSGQVRQQTLDMLKELRARASHPDRFVVKAQGRAFLVKIQDIDWIEAEGKYVRLHVGKEAHLLRESIGTIEERLDPKQFPRIHRSTIVNIDRIRELQPWFHHEYKVVMRDGTELTLSRGCRKRLSELLANSL